MQLNRLFASFVFGFGLLTANALPAQAHEICAILYEHADFGGNSYVVFGDYTEVPYVGKWWNDRISSVRVVPGCSLTLFEHTNYQGLPYHIDSDLSYVGNLFNDRASAFTCYCNH